MGSSDGVPTFVSAAKDRHVSVWKVERGSSSGGVQRAAFATRVIKDEPSAQMACGVGGAVALVTRGGGVCVLKSSSKLSAGKSPRGPDFSSAPSHAIAVFLSPSSQGGE